MYGCVGTLVQEFSALYCTAGRFRDAQRLQILLADLGHIHLLGAVEPNTLQLELKQKVLGKILALEVLAAPEAPEVSMACYSSFKAPEDHRIHA